MEKVIQCNFVKKKWEKNEKKCECAPSQCFWHDFYVYSVNRFTQINQIVYQNIKP